MRTGLVRKRRLSDDVAEHLAADDPGRHLRGSGPAAVRARADASLRRRPAVGARGAAAPAQDGARRGRLRRARPRHPPDAAVRDRRPERHRPPHDRRTRRRPELPECARLLRGRARAPRRRSMPPRRSSPASRPALEANRHSIGDLERFERTDVDFHYVLAADAAEPDLHRDPRRPRRVAARAAAHHARPRRGRQGLRGAPRRSSRRSQRATPTAPSARCASISTTSPGATPTIVGAAPMTGFVVIVDFRLKPGAARRLPPPGRRQRRASVRQRARLPPFRRRRAEGRGGPGPALRNLRRRGGLRGALPIGALRRFDRDSEPLVDRTSR